MINENQKLPAQEVKKPSRKKEISKPTGLLAVIRIRGEVGVRGKIEDTMRILRLHKKNRCNVIPATKDYLGMLGKVKDYCTFGEIDEQTLTLLLEKRGRIAGNNALTAEYLKKKLKIDFAGFAAKIMKGEMKLKDLEGLKLFFKLHPPIGGFERSGIKRAYSVGGALGYRRAEINKIIRRML